MTYVCPPLPDNHATGWFPHPRPFLTLPSFWHYHLSLKTASSFNMPKCPWLSGVKFRKFKNWKEKMASESVGHWFGGHLPKFLGMCVNLWSANFSLSTLFMSMFMNVNIHSSNWDFTSIQSHSPSYHPTVVVQTIWVLALPLMNIHDTCVQLMVPKTNQQTSSNAWNKILFW